MTDFAALFTTDRGQKARVIHLVHKDSFEKWAKARPAEDRALLKAHRFDGTKAFAFVLLPRGGDFEVVSAVANAGELSPWCLATLGREPARRQLRSPSGEPGKAALGWLLAQHRFDAYRSKKETGARVRACSSPANRRGSTRRSGSPKPPRWSATSSTRPPPTSAPPSSSRRCARRPTARARRFESPRGDELAKGYPLIAAVGAAATPDRAPRLIELEWGKPGDPRIAIVGKGVCFDSGGLDLKPAAGMRIMKKDMGGAAHALALARLIVAERLPVRLHLLIPAVENAVSGSAYRPGDIVKSRKGLFVEIDNTDAEGRLILADALTRAGEDEARADRRFRDPDRRRARRARSRPPGLVRQSRRSRRCDRAAARDVDDPLWRMPLWDPYDEMLKSDVADLANVANNPMAGCIYAALFLQALRSRGHRLGASRHLGMARSGKPGRPKGGDALGLRAIFAHARGPLSAALNGGSPKIRAFWATALQHFASLPV